jgi:inosose dehydratase
MKTAINPLQWMTLRPGGVEMVRELSQNEMLRQVREAGFRAVLAEPDPGQSVNAYRRVLAAAHLEAAPGYFSGRLSDSDHLEEILQAARSFADGHRELGLTEACVADDIYEERLRTPPSMHRPLPTDVIGRIAEAINEIALVWKQFGLIACVHNHVGSHIETEAEIDRILELTSPSGVAFCPDTGHLRWVGVDPAAIVRRHHGRIRLLHIKDARRAVVEMGTSRRWGYGEFVKAGLWAEPGSGDIDLHAVFMGLERFDGWVIFEVDHSSVAPVESARRCAGWAQPLLESEHV